LWLAVERLLIGTLLKRLGRGLVPKVVKQGRAVKGARAHKVVAVKVVKGAESNAWFRSNA
jgi:hypothetical protein